MPAVSHACVLTTSFSSSIFSGVIAPWPGSVSSPFFPGPMMWTHRESFWNLRRSPRWIVITGTPSVPR